MFLLTLNLLSLLFAVSQFETEFYISGLAPLCDQLVVLSFVKEVSEKTVIFFLIPQMQREVWVHFLAL